MDYRNVQKFTEIPDYCLASLYLGNNPEIQKRPISLICIMWVKELEKKVGNLFSKFGYVKTKDGQVYLLAI